MSYPKLDYLKANLSSIEGLLARAIKANDRIGRIQYAHRKHELLEEIKAEEELQKFIMEKNRC